MNTFHISKSGKPAQCRAKKGSCPLGNIDHFNSREEAESFIVSQLEKDYGVVPVPLNKQEETNNSQIPDTYSAEVSKNYAHLSIITGHMHNGAEVGNDLELYYYSSPQGRLELERRIQNNKRLKNNDYQKIKDIIDSPEYEPIKFEFKNLEETIEKGNKSYNTGWLNDAKNNMLNVDSDGRTTNQDTIPLKHSLVDYSHKWLNNLSTEQQESISFLTSNGFVILQATTNNNDENYNNPAFNSYVNADDFYNKYNDSEEAEQKILEAKKELAERLRKNVYDSFSKAPVLDEPIMTYRGTDINEVKDILGLDKEMGNKEAMNALLSGEYNGKEINKAARVNKIPVSSSANPANAASFGSSVIIEIKRKTMTTPVNVSAWGSAETEVLTNPTSTYKIHGGYLQKDENGRKFLSLQIEEQEPEKQE